MRCGFDCCSGCYECFAPPQPSPPPPPALPPQVQVRAELMCGASLLEGEPGLCAAWCADHSKRLTLSPTLTDHHFTRSRSRSRSRSRTLTRARTRARARTLTRCADHRFGSLYAGMFGADGLESSWYTRGALTLALTLSLTLSLSLTRTRTRTRTPNPNPNSNPDPNLLRRTLTPTLTLTRYTRCKFDCCAGCHQCGEAEALSAPPKHQCIPSCHNDTLDSCLDTAAYPG